MHGRGVGCYVLQGSLLRPLTRMCAIGARGAADSGQNLTSESYTIDINKIAVLILTIYIYI